MTIHEFTQKTNQLENLLFSFALRLTKSRQDAEDLMQETKIKAFKYRNKYTQGTNFKGWISTIMRNTFINQYRKAKIRRHLNHTVEDHTASVSVLHSVENAGEQSLRMKELKRMLDSIGDIYSVPFLMFYRGFEYQEIAEKLDIPIGTVKSRIFTARTKMKGLLKGRRQAV